MLYKSVICTGRVDFAYEVIAYGEAFAYVSRLVDAEVIDVNSFNDGWDFW